MGDTMQTAPVSCVIAAYNAAAYIEQAVFSLVHQTRPPSEIILVDDGSTDGTAALAENAGGSILRVIRQDNAGVASARNVGLAEVSQPYVLFADADDISLENRISMCMHAFDSDPKVDAVFGNWQNFWIDDLAYEEQDMEITVPKGEQFSRSLCTGMLRTEVARANVKFDPSLSLSEVFWVVQLIKSGARIHDLGHKTYHRRIHHSNASRRKRPDDLFDMISALRKK